MSCASQLTTDTLCFPTKVVRGLLIDAQRKDILEDEVKNLDARIADLLRRITSDSLHTVAQLASMRREVVLLEDQKLIVMDEASSLKKQLRRARRGKRLTALAGIITTVAGVVFIK